MEEEEVRGQEQLQCDVIALLLKVCLSVGMSVCWYVCLLVCMSVCWYVCLSVCWYVCLSVASCCEQWALWLAAVSAVASCCEQ